MLLFPDGIPLAKRLFDLMATTIGVIVISPLLLALVLLESFLIGSPILFSQVRPGYKGLPFRIYKFRTMTNHTGPDGDLLPDSKRVTTLGRFLRSTSLDELPELINVLRGEMSLVGPRPLLMEYLERYTPEQARRHDVTPGITGWAQVNGRNAITWESKFALDLWYVDHWSFWLDIRILFLTLWKVVKREGISQPGYASARIFSGSEQEQPPE
ncbi:MAG: sugar transferase [Chloroflexota bacterium]